MKIFLKCLLLTVLFSCKKETPIPEANKQLAQQFQTTLQQHLYRLAAYYSETPIDYEPTDTVGAKTNHWEYVSYYLKDDDVQFKDNGQVEINQKFNLMPGNDEQIFSRSYKVTPDQQGVEFEYLNFTYEPLKYRLIELSDTAFIVKAKWNGNDVISKFKVIP